MGYDSKKLRNFSEENNILNSEWSTCTTTIGRLHPVKHDEILARLVFFTTFNNRIHYKPVGSAPVVHSRATRGPHVRMRGDRICTRTDAPAQPDLMSDRKTEFAFLALSQAQTNLVSPPRSARRTGMISVPLAGTSTYSQNDCRGQFQRSVCCATTWEDEDDAPFPCCTSVPFSLYDVKKWMRVSKP